MSPIECYEKVLNGQTMEKTIDTGKDKRTKYLIQGFPKSSAASGRIVSFNQKYNQNRGEWEQDGEKRDDVTLWPGDRFTFEDNNQALAL